METEISKILDNLENMRHEVFGQDEKLYKLFGLSMGRLIDARKLIREKTGA